MTRTRESNIWTHWFQSDGHSWMIWRPIRPSGAYDISTRSVARRHHESSLGTIHRKSRLRQRSSPSSSTQMWNVALTLGQNGECWT